jgi:metal-responsive CopG/Arc/MetJ family transcriptional regulator
MQRTQVYLTDQQQAGLKRIAELQGQKKSELIRLAIDSFLASCEEKGDWKKNLRKVRGVWDNHTTLDKNLSQVRKEFDRFNPMP